MRLTPLILVFFVVACGVPISAAEIAATAEVEERDGAAAAVQESTSGSEQSASIAASQAGQPAVEGSPAAALSPTEVAMLSALETELEDGPPADPSLEDPTPTATLAPGETPEPAASAGPEGTATPGPAPTEYASQAVAILNEIRADMGLPPLQTHLNMALAAQGYARYMADNNYSRSYFGHTGLDGSTPNSRLLDAGYERGCKGEAISAGQRSPRAAINAWLRSPRHAGILLDPLASEVGVGYEFRSGTFYGHYWVLNTGPSAVPCQP